MDLFSCDFYGHIHVSSQDQDEERQLIVLKKKLVDPKMTVWK